MKVTRIILKDFQQFKNFDLDLTDKSTGRPLEKVCFIGRNGTGKSTLLRLVWKKLKDVHAGLRTGFQWHIEEPAILIKFELERGSFWLCANAGKAGTLFDEDIENSADWTLLTQSVSGAASTNRREVQGRFRKYLLSEQKYKCAASAPASDP
jgi:predicted ATP-binding protein involved in virulence